MSSTYYVGQIVEMEITDAGWETTVTSTIISIIRSVYSIDYILATSFNIYSGDAALEGEIGFSELPSGCVCTTQHSLDCVVRLIKP